MWDLTLVEEESRKRAIFSSSGLRLLHYNQNVYKCISHTLTLQRLSYQILPNCFQANTKWQYLQMSQNNTNVHTWIKMFHVPIWENVPIWKRWDPTSVGERNEAFFIRVWKHLSSKCVLTTLKGSPKGKAVTNGIRARHRATCERGSWALKGVDTRRCASKDAGTQRGWIGGSHIDGEGNECPREYQRGR